MSLINQMLKDLENRTAPPPEAGGCATPRAVSARRRGMRKALWYGLALLLASGVACLWAVRPAVVAPPAAPAVAAAAPEGAAPNLPAPPVVVAPNAAAAVPVVVEAVRLTPLPDGVQVAIALSGPPAYRLLRAEQGLQLVLDLPGGEQVAELPDAAGLPLIENLQVVPGPSGVRLAFHLSESCRYEALSLDAGAAGGEQVLSFTLVPEAVLADQPDPPVDRADARTAAAEPLPSPTPAQESAAVEVAPPAPEFVRQAAPPTPYQQAAADCRDGIAALQQGNLVAAETALRSALALDPEHIGARDMLLRLLATQQRRTELIAVLAEGVRLLPGHLPYRERYARLLIESGSLPEARYLLLRAPRPSVAEAPNMYAMLAALYQRQGQYGDAAQIYRALLRLDAHQALWWMGLGIALEGTLSVDEARDAYRQALSCGGLSATLQDYVRQRLGLLEPAAAQKPAAKLNAGEERS